MEKQYRRPHRFKLDPGGHWWWDRGILRHSACGWGVSRTKSATSCIQRIPSPSPPKAAPKLKYSHVVESTLRPHNPGKLSHDLPRDWSSTRSQVATRSPDRARFRRMPSPLIGTWKTVGMINKPTNQPTSHETMEHSKGTHLLPVFVPALKYGPPVWVCMPALNMYAQTTLY